MTEALPMVCRVHRRCGFLSAVILALLSVSTALCALWVHAAVQNVQRQRLEEDRIQGKWLAAAGVRRGAAQLARDNKYTGEKWRIEGKEFSRPQGAVVEIQIEPADDLRGSVHISARASYPEGAPRVRVSKTVAFSDLSEEPSP
jgi:hypothetical protein